MYTLWPICFFDHRAVALYHPLENVVGPPFFSFQVTLGELRRFEREAVPLLSLALIGREPLLIEGNPALRRRSEDQLTRVVPTFDAQPLVGSYSFPK